MLYIKEIFFLVLFQICVTEELYREINELMTWEKAKDHCTLATPELVYQGQIPTVKINQNLTNDENGMWLGYYRNLRGFEYIGCIGYPKDFANIPSKDIENNSPGYCFSACGRVGTTVGLMGQKCYCFGTDTAVDNEVSNSSCYMSCSSPAEELACGGQSRISLYIVNQRVLLVQKVFGMNNAGNNCVRLASDNMLLWDNCRSSLQSICEEGTSIIYNFPAPSTGSQNFKWVKSNNLCFGNNKGRPLRYKDAVIFQNSSGESWTGICRSLSVFSYSEQIVGTDHIEYGFLIKSAASDRYELHFTNNLSEIKKSRCRSHTSKPDEYSNDNDKSVTAVAIGVSVAVISLIIAVVVVCVTLRKKNTTLFQCFSLHKNDNVSVPHYHDKAIRNSHENVSAVKTSNPLNNECFDQNFEALPMDDDSPHKYFVLETIEKRTSNLNSISNKAGPGHSASIEDQRKNYNRCKLGENTTYDRVNSPHNGEDKNEYDTTKKAVAKIKTKSNTDNLQDSVEDTYNHLNREQTKRVTTDNVYGIPYQVKNFNDGYESQKSTPQEGDTYNHIHNTTLRKAKTDNVYGIH